MGTIVCQSCSQTIGHFEDEKVTTLYAKNEECNCEKIEVSEQ